MVIYQSVEDSLQCMQNQQKSSEKAKTMQLLLQGNQNYRELPEFTLGVARIKENGEYRGCRSENELLQYVKELKNLSLDIQAFGYKRQHQLGGSKFFGEVEAALDERGRLFKMNSGNHRFAVAHYLGIKKLPVHLAIIHAKALGKEKYRNRFEFIRVMRKKIAEAEQRYS